MYARNSFEEYNFWNSDYKPGGYSTKVSWYGEAGRRGPIPYLLYAIIHEIGTPFVYLPLTNGTPFTYLV